MPASPSASYPPPNSPKNACAATARPRSSSAELLAIVLGLTDLGQAETLLAPTRAWPAWRRAPLSELTSHYRGIGPRQSARSSKPRWNWAAAAIVTAGADRLQVKSPADVAGLLLAEMGALEQEELRIVILDTKNHVLKVHTQYVGSLNTAVVRVGELFREAIRLNAAAIIVCTQPSLRANRPRLRRTFTRTRQLVEAGKLLSIEVLDHLVIGHSGRWLSLKERGLGF